MHGKDIVIGRIRKGLSQKQLAARLSIGVEQLARYEKDLVKNPSESVLKEIKEILDIEEDD